MCSSNLTSREKQCRLCGGKDRQMSQYANAGEHVKKFIMKHLGHTIQEELWICKKHLLEAQRYCNVDGYVPKWKK